MLSKEEIKKDIKKLRNISECFTYFMWSEDTEALRRILDYIDQLESDKQKLIEKLEEDINELETLNDNYTEADIIEGIYTTRGQIIKTREILSILKGE